jgi:hypothetical protein
VRFDKGGALCAAHAGDVRDDRHVGRKQLPATRPCFRVDHDWTPVSLGQVQQQVGRRDEDWPVGRADEFAIAVRIRLKQCGLFWVIIEI